MPRESAYQRGLIQRIKQRFPGCYVTTDLKAQGLPDLLILFGDRWSMLEVKRSANEVLQPNQQWWVDHFNGWSFCAIIHPDNEQEILDELERVLVGSRVS